MRSTVRKELAGTKMENWPIGKRVGGSSLLPFPQHHSQRCVQWAYSRRNCTTEKWRRSETRTERNALTVCCLTMRLQHARTRWFAWPVSGQDTGVPSATSHYQEQEVTPLTSTRREGKPQILSPLTLPKPPHPTPPSPSPDPETIPPSQEVFDNAICSAPPEGGRKGKKEEKGRKIQAVLDAVFHPSRDAANKRQRQRGSSSEKEEEEKSKRLAAHAASATEKKKKKNAAAANQERKRAVGLRQDNKFTPPIYDPLSTYATPNGQRDPISDTEVMLTVQWRTHYV